ncbi:hypothetical protein JG688_00018658 [Phytophthora aleatoria]|uniref:Uncharacterized protein n=1 Tax=Phytophthora aleatoria TaxID=2496075 RepID=A0A8J5IP91_9STRA|nr:hypothetical protein JG688_00018658 [Phytophthora aleatoria]
MTQLLMHCGEDEGEYIEVVSVWALVYMYALNVRSEKTVLPPFLWGEYRSGVLARPGRFQRRYSMSYDAFSQLCCWLEPTLRILHPYSSVHSDIVLHCTLRWLAGGSSYDDISAIAMMSVPTFFRYVNSGMTALLACEELAIKFPTTRDEMKAQSEAFATKSLGGVLKGLWMAGCVRLKHQPNVKRVM